MYGHPTQQHPAATRQVAVAACTFDLAGQAPDEIKLTPAGTFRARDGRPQGLPGWRIDAVIAARVIERARDAVGDFVVDYEHQTLYAEANGQPAPAGGWWSGAGMEWREGQGLYATGVQWTDRARAAIEAREYRYISPVIAYDPATGEVRGIVMAALTNYPAIDGLSDLTRLAAARFQINPQQEDNTVNREQLIALLGLADDATEQQITEAMTDLKTQATAITEELADLRKALGVKEGGDAVATVAALKGATRKPDPAKYVPVETVAELQEQVAALSTKITNNEVDDLVDTALADGKLLPALEAWARELGGKDIEALKAYIDNATPIAALKGRQTGGKEPDGDGGSGELDAAALAVCTQMGIDPDEYKKNLTAA